ncbi:uncharacterized protein LOC144016045 [Festucalex cinctus]
MCAITNVTYEKELCGAQGENERQQQLLDAVCQQPRVVLNRADVSEKYLCPELQEPEFLGVKEENWEPLQVKEEEQSQPPNVKEEEQLLPYIKEEEEDFTELPVTGVHLKIEDECQYEENKWAEPSNSSRQQITEYDEDHRGESQANSRLALMSDGEDTSHSPHADDYEQSDDDLTCHTESKRWKCSQCGKTFVSKSKLRRHVLGHTGDKPFACSVCGRRFSEKGSLKRHTGTHTGEKLFACSVCGRSFSQNGSLKIHTRTHTGEKPFVCLVCGQNFAHRGSLKIHTRKHTGERPFACSVCGQNFAHKGNLKQHTRTHTGERPFACSVCGQNFAHKGNLKQHTRTHW